MEVAGLCSVCQRPGALSTCVVCGALAHPRCLESGAHAHAGAAPGGRTPFRDWGAPRT